MWKAFHELKALGWLDGASLPRMVAVQAAGCQPIVEAFLAGAETASFYENAATLASGLRVPSAFADRAILRARGVAAVFRARRIKVGAGANYKLNFSPARAV